MRYIDLSFLLELRVSDIYRLKNKLKRFRQPDNDEKIQEEFAKKLLKKLRKNESRELARKL